jgi:hypothetical protein
METTAVPPGVYFTVVPPPDVRSPLRTDIACFIGPTARGAINRAVRVEGWKGYRAWFGELDPRFDTPYAVQSYFTNAGEVAYILRLGGRSAVGADPRSAAAEIATREFDGAAWHPSSLAIFPRATYRIEATSPGLWGDELRVQIQFRQNGLQNRPEVDILVSSPTEPAEYLQRLNPFPDQGEPEDPWLLSRLVEERSRLIRIIPLDDPIPLRPSGGPRFRRWDVRLRGGADPTSGRADYLDAVNVCLQEPEIALMAMPDLFQQVPDADDYIDVLQTAIAEADALHDRQIIVDLPPCPSTGRSRDAASAIAWARWLRGRVTGTERSAAIYHPPVRVLDPFGGAAHPLRLIPPSGSVSGVISRLDRERSPYHTPANATLYEVVDVESRFLDGEQGALNEGGVNVLRCAPGKGIQIWGGRSLAVPPDSPFLAHRRLIHRLVRAIRRVAEPLVFDVNGPPLWQAFQRAITGVLLRAFRSGALKGARPEQAFQVKCDAETNPPDSIDVGRVICLISVAPAVPMEFITLRIAMSAEGALEVFEQ